MKENASLTDSLTPPQLTGPAGPSAAQRHHADAIRSHRLRSLTELDLRGNQLCDEGWSAIFFALRDEPDNVLTKLDLRGEFLGPLAVKALASCVAVSSTLKDFRLGGTERKIGPDGWRIIFGALRTNPKIQLESWDLSSQGLDDEVAVPLAG